MSRHAPPGAQSSSSRFSFASRVAPPSAQPASDASRSTPPGSQPSRTNSAQFSFALASASARASAFQS